MFLTVRPFRLSLCGFVFLFGLFRYNSVDFFRLFLCPLCRFLLTLPFELPLVAAFITAVFRVILYCNEGFPAYRTDTLAFSALRGLFTIKLSPAVLIAVHGVRIFGFKGFSATFTSELIRFSGNNQAFLNLAVSLFLAHTFCAVLRASSAVLQSLPILPASVPAGAPGNSR